MKKAEAFFACIMAPALPLQALVRSEPGLAGCPLASVHGTGTTARVDFISAAARARGIKVGMTPSQARSLAPDVTLRRPSPELMRVTHQALLDLASSFSHAVQDGDSGVALLDVTGHQHIHGSYLLMGQAIVKAAAENGLTVRTGFAAGVRLARIASRIGDPVVVLTPGTEAAAIAHLGIRVLEPSGELAARFIQLKLSRVGELAALPSTGIGSRLGADGVTLHSLSRGMDDTVIEAPLVRQNRFQECVSLDYTLDNLEPLVFLLSAATDRILRRLELRGLCPGRIGLTLNLDPAGLHAINLQPSGLVENPSTIATLLHRTLIRTPPPAPVRGFMLTIESGTPATAQCQLFGPPAPNPARIRDLTGRLAVIVGDGNAGSPEITETRHQYSTVLRPFRLVPAAVTAGPTRHDCPDMPTPLAFRRFNPPVQALVESSVAERRGGMDVFADTQRPDDQAMPLRIHSDALSGTVQRAAGPWYADSGWWTDQPRAGAFYDVEIAGRGVFRLWHDLLSDQWTIEGIWD